MRQTAHIIDGTWLVVAAYYSTPQSDGLRDRSGHPTNALFGLVRYLQTQVEEEAPDYLQVVFDNGRKTWRHRVWPEYKAGRSVHPDELLFQRDKAPELCEAVDLQVHVAPDHAEGDDVIATLCHKYRQDGTDVVIHSVDSDFWQLLTPANGGPVSPLGSVHMWDRQHKCLWSAQAVYDKVGVWPRQIAEWKALAGDRCDGIPGVPGVGPITASLLLQQFHTIDNILAHLKTLSRLSKRERAILTCTALRKYREITQLDSTVKLSAAWSLKAKTEGLKGVLHLFTDFGFDTAPDITGHCTVSREV